MNTEYALIIPALNPGGELYDYVQSGVRSGFSHIVVVDDGSGEDCTDLFARLETCGGVTVLRHRQNRGKGRALKTAFSFCMQKGKLWGLRGVITVDSDGQHRMEDVCRIAEAMDGTSLLLGCRELIGKDVPPKSRFGNLLTCRVFRLLYGIWISDTQTGLRGIPIALLPLFEQMRGERYEYETEMLIKAVKNKIEIKEVNIETIYTDDNVGTHFRPIVDSAKIYVVLFKSFLWYTFSSLSASVLDVFAFFLSNHLLLAHLGPEKRVLLSTISARIVSSVYNFTVNRSLAFRSEGKMGSQIVRYYGLAVVQMLFSAGFVIFLVRLLPLADTVVKILVDTCLFFVSYRIQKRWIFKS